MGTNATCVVAAVCNLLTLSRHDACQWPVAHLGHKAFRTRIHIYGVDSIRLHQVNVQRCVASTGTWSKQTCWLASKTIWPMTCTTSETASKFEVCYVQTRMARVQGCTYLQNCQHVAPAHCREGTAQKQTQHKQHIHNLSVRCIIMSECALLRTKILRLQAPMWQTRVQLTGCLLSTKHHRNTCN